MIIIGGGVLGACLYHHLCRRGCTVLLADKADFGSGTSQSSGMLVWGGLLYLRNGDLRTVRRLSNARNELVRESNGQVHSADCRLFLSGERLFDRHVHTLALHAYWLLGGCRQRRPRWKARVEENELLRNNGHGPLHLHYEEAALTHSDARFTLSWILNHQSPREVPLNHCVVDGGSFDGNGGFWRVAVFDRILAAGGEACARVVVNASGVWTSDVNDRFGIASTYKHIISKGVFLGVARDARHQSALFLKTRDSRDVLSLIPWGPVSLWGPTETMVATPGDGFDVRPDEIRWLLDEANRNLAHAISPEDIVSIRCGARALAVPCAQQAAGSSLGLTRRFYIDRKESPPWISIYGGKLTDCVTLARRISGMLPSACHREATPPEPRGLDVPARAFHAHPAFPGNVSSAKWCAEHELCWTLEDYLRRRTNIAQWVPRCGIGRRNEYVDLIAEYARQIECRPGVDPDRVVHQYVKSVRDHFDAVIADCQDLPE